MLLLHKINTLVLSSSLMFCICQYNLNLIKKNMLNLVLQVVILSYLYTISDRNFLLFHFYFYFHFGGRQVNKEANTFDDNFTKIAIVNNLHRCHKTSSDIVAKTVLTRFFSPFLCFLSPARFEFSSLREQSPCIITNQFSH